MKNRRALTFAIALGLVSFLLLYFYVSNIEKRYLGDHEPVAVMVAKEDIEQFADLNDSVWRKVNIPKPFVQPLVVTEAEKDKYVYHTAAVPIKKGEQITKTKLNLPGQTGISPIIPKGARACTISVSEVTGVGGHIRGGDTVDVIGTFKTLNDKRAVKDLEAVTLFQNVVVLATGKNYQYENRNVPTKSKSGLVNYSESRNNFSTVTLQVSPRTCMDLAIAQQTGTLTLMLRSYYDRFNSATDASLKDDRSTTESVTGIKEPIQIKETPQWLEQRGDQSVFVP